jgi:hypothetical protein
LFRSLRSASATWSPKAVHAHEDHSLR